MDTIRICQQSRKPLPQNAPEGICPGCLARMALDSEPTASEVGAPPDPAKLKTNCAMSWAPSPSNSRMFVTLGGNFFCNG